MWKLTEVVTGPENVRKTLNQHIGVTNVERILERNQRVFIVPGVIKISFSDHEAKIYEYDPKHEENDIEPVLSSIIPLCKSVSLLPHTAKGVYPQSPEEGITEEEYKERLADLKPIDWTSFGGSDGVDEAYCQGETCEIPN
jgi:hypothetical protein